MMGPIMVGSSSSWYGVMEEMVVMRSRHIS
jgi:hypothetical protein